jgi:hypothetical protein
VGPDYHVPVAPGGELDPALYPDDVMAATLATGVRKLPATPEREVVRTLWNSQLAIPIESSDDSNRSTVANAPMRATSSRTDPAAATNAVDHAIATLGTTAEAIGPLPSASLPGNESPNHAGRTHRNGHAVIVEPRHNLAIHGRTRWPNQAVARDHSEAHRMPGSQPPDGSLAIRFSRLGAGRTKKAQDR